MGCKDLMHTRAWPEHRGQRRGLLALGTLSVRGAGGHSEPTEVPMPPTGPGISNLPPGLRLLGVDSDGKLIFIDAAVGNDPVVRKSSTSHQSAEPAVRRCNSFGASWGGDKVGLVSRQRGRRLLRRVGMEIKGRRTEKAEGALYRLWSREGTGIWRKA